MTQTLTISKWHPANIANGPHGHWRLKHQRHTEAETIAVLQARLEKWKRIEGKVRLAIVFVYPRKYRVDTDNLYARVKGLVDGLKGRYFEDDDTEHLDLHVSAIVEKGRKETRVVLQSANEGVSLGNGQ